MWVRTRTGAQSREVVTNGDRRVAVTFPAGEVVTLPRHLGVEVVRGWMITSRLTARTLRLAAPILPTALRGLGPLLDFLLSRGSAGPDEATRRATRFTILIKGRSANGASNRLTIEGSDPYGLTAAIVARGVRRLLRPAKGTSASADSGARSDSVSPPTGVVDPAQLMEPRGFLDGLRERGLVWS